MIEMKKLKCKRCGHKWFRRKIKLPLVCPNCKSPYWNKERGWWKKKAKIDYNEVFDPEEGVEEYEAQRDREDERDSERMNYYNL